MSLLVIHPGSVGDTILALPVLAALKHRFHPAALHLIGHPSLSNVLPGRSVVDSMQSIDGGEYRILMQGKAHMPSAASRFFQNFEVAVVWAADQEGSVSQTLLSLGIARVVVRSPGLRARSSRHATDRFRDTVADLLEDGPLPAICLKATAKDKGCGLQWLTEHGLRRRPIVMMHPGSGSPAKCWAPESFAQVARDLGGAGNIVIFLEGPADPGTTSALTQTVHGLLVPWLRNADLSLVVGILAHCAAFLGNDSGMTQLAAALGIPTVGIYGPTSPDVWAYRGKRVIPLRGELACRCPTLESQRACLDRVCFSIRPEIVAHTVRELVRASPTSLATHSPLC